MFEVMGIKSESTPKNWADKFEEVFYDMGHSIFVEKETRKHEEDGFTFQYKYAIQYEYGLYELLLCVIPEDISEDNKKSVAESCCIELDDVEVIDEIFYGLYVQMAADGKFVEDCEDYANDDVVNKIASVYECIDGLRGFYLDKPLNAIGTTGWDCLANAIKDEPLLKI